VKTRTPVRHANTSVLQETPKNCRFVFACLTLAQFRVSADG